MSPRDCCAVCKYWHKLPDTHHLFEYQERMKESEWGECSKVGSFLFCGLDEPEANPESDAVIMSGSISGANLLTKPGFCCQSFVLTDISLGDL